MWAQRPIVEKHARYALYRPSAEAIASRVCDLPNRCFTSLVFNFSVYFMTKLRQDVSGFFIFWLFGFTTLVTMLMLFRAVGSLSRTYSQSMTPVGTLIFGFTIYTGFPVPVKYQRPWLSWFRFSNPVSYAYEALMVNEANNIV
jgi:ATP-binding cassette subfamily G (WHITE) protein 2 (PDR)